MTGDLANTDKMGASLRAALARGMPGLQSIAGLRQLSGGAMQETWSFTATGAFGEQPLILRRARGRLRADRSYGIELAGEAAIMRIAEQGGVPVAHVRHVLQPAEGLGDGFIMDFVAGETIPRRILRDAGFAALRQRLAGDCGAALAAMARLDVGNIPGCERRQAPASIDRIFHDYEALDAPGPVFELAFRWLRQNMPDDLPRLSLVHGDFRLGNLLVGADRLRAVLDWEMAHVGDPHEDLGYISMRSWRFGEIDQEVGGFAKRAALVAAYEQAGGGPVDLARVHFWEVACTLRWGIQCAQMAGQFLTGIDGSVERGAIGRRRSETELDLLLLLDEAGHHAG